MSGNPHPWRIMTLVFGAVLLCSFALQHFLSPAGNAVMRAVNSRSASLTGTIDTQPGSAIVFHAAAGAYAVANPSAARSYTGRAVRVSGVLHEDTGEIEIRTIETIDPFLTKPVNAQ